MNKKQRDRLEGIKDKLIDLKQELEEMRDEEQAKYDNAPENLQQSEQYTRIESIAEKLSDSVDNLDQVDSDLDAALSI